MMTMLANMTMMTAYIRLHLHLHVNLHLHCITLHDKREHQLYTINQNKMQLYRSVQYVLNT